MKSIEVRLQSPPTNYMKENGYPEISRLEILDSPTPCITVYLSSYLPQFYLRIEHKASPSALEKLKSLGLYNIETSEKFELPSDTPDDEIYFGQWICNRREGLGIQVNKDGSIYTGEFFNDCFKGEGRLIYNNGDYYEGRFKKSLPHGKGVKFCASKYITGYFFKGEPKGLCRIDWKKAMYSGNFKDGKRNGIGVLKEKNREYKGEFFENTIQGFGQCTWTNGKNYEGEWSNNKMNGFGIFKWPDGRYYEGNYLNDKKHGKGKMVWPNGKVYDGEWEDGIRHGEALYTYFNKLTNEAISKKSRWYQGQRVEWLE